MFFGWRVVAGSFIALMLVLGFFTYSFTLFVTPLREEFGASLEQVMYSLTLGTLLSLFASPVTGILVDRMSIRILMTLGALVTAAGFFSMSAASSIGAFNLTFALTFALSNAMVGTMAGSAAVSRWFLRNRGRALGITTIGTSVGGIAIPALAAWWIAELGWRGAFQNLALMSLLLAPILWLTIRGRPSELGMHPDGDPPPDISQHADTSGGAQPGPADAAPGMKEIVVRRDFWLIGLSVGLLIATFSSTLSNLSPYATGLGASQAQASTLIMLLAITGLIGKLIFGMAADRFSLKWGLWASQGLVCIAFLLMSTEPPYAVIVVAALCMGFATGGLLPVWNAMMAQVFGVDSFGRAMGAMGPVITLLVMPAYILVGRLHDLNGNYVVILTGFAVTVIIAALLLAPVRLPKTH